MSRSHVLPITIFKASPYYHPSAVENEKVCERGREREREQKRMPRFTTATYKEQFSACSHFGLTLSRSQVSPTSLIIDGSGKRERERERERKRERLKN
jgi:hypothetical protein